jgi:hypothetical protein
MRRVFKVSMWAIIIIVVVGAGLLGAARLFTFDMCGNRVVAEIKSPDGMYKAIEFERDCGATTDFSTQVSVIQPNKHLGSDSTGNAFAADSNHGIVPVNDAGVLDLDIRWLSNNTLQIDYPAGARVFSQNHKVGGVSIQYATH